MKSIKDWAEDDRPREKLLTKGKEALSNAELIAILIGSGNRKETAVDLSKKILNSVKNNWNELAKLTVKDLCKFNGIGEAKAVSILTAMEIGRRRASQAGLEKPKITSSEDVFKLLHPLLSDLPHEEFWVIFLNQSNKVIHQEQISKGGISSTVVDSRLILKTALSCNATAIILAHNHPSGSLKPSQPDLNLTEKIKKAAALLDIKLLDHLILNQTDYFSFADNDLI